LDDLRLTVRGRLGLSEQLLNLVVHFLLADAKEDVVLANLINCCPVEVHNCGGIGRLNELLICQFIPDVVLMRGVTRPGQQGNGGKVEKNISRNVEDPEQRNRACTAESYFSAGSTSFARPVSKRRLE